MFDTYRPPFNVGPSHVSVTEKRAPTDESVRLLREMERKAEAQVLQSVRVENTPVDAVLHVRQDVLDARTYVGCVFKLNGKTLRAEYAAKWDDDRHAVFVGVRDAMAQEIANYLTDSAYQAALRLDMRFFNKLP